MKPCFALAPLTAIDIADTGLAAERFAALCELAAGFGMNCALGFAAGLGVGSVQKANAVVSAAAQANGASMLDPFHRLRSGGSVADLTDVDPSRLLCAPFCDAPSLPPPTLQATSEEARYERLCPGPAGPGTTASRRSPMPTPPRAPDVAPTFVRP